MASAQEIDAMASNESGQENAAAKEVEDTTETGNVEAKDSGESGAAVNQDVEEKDIDEVTKGQDTAGEDTATTVKSEEIAAKDTAEEGKGAEEVSQNQETASGGKTQDQTFGRKLDFMEVVSIKCEANVTHVMVVESKYIINEDLLRQAAEMLSRRHPLLRSRVTTEIEPRKRKEVFFYREIEKEENLIDLRIVDEVDWHETQVNDGETLYDTENGPLWRLWLLKSVEITPEESETGHLFKTNIVVGYHHAIMDANTGMRFIDQLLTYLEMIVQVASAAKIEVESLPFLSSYYDQLPPQALRFPWWQKPKLATLAVKELFKSSKNLYIKHHQAEIDKNPDIAKRVEILPLVIPKSLTSEIMKCSKQHGVTVHGTITAASAVAMMQLIYGPEFQCKKEISTMFQINMRRYLPSDEGGDHLGAFFGNAEMPIKVSRVSKEEEFWKLAKTCYQNVHRMLGGEVMEIAKIYKYLCDDLGLDLVKIVVKDKAPHGRMKQVLSISNMGRCDFVTRENGRAFELTGTYMTAAPLRVGPIFVNNFFTFRGKMYVSIVYYSHITSKDRAKEYADFFVRALEIGCQSND
ncbi:uncharacterized protein [Ptychodera flava]|uniref:uncharacterized protein n=1 Tax=Ptychodera flava TaxID=63121 RepID=UPI00396A53FF